MSASDNLGNHTLTSRVQVIHKVDIKVQELVGEVVLNSGRNRAEEQWELRSMCDYECIV